MTPTEVRETFYPHADELLETTVLKAAEAFLEVYDEFLEAAEDADAAAAQAGEDPADLLPGYDLEDVSVPLIALRNAAGARARIRAARRIARRDLYAADAAVRSAAAAAIWPDRGFGGEAA